MHLVCGKVGISPDCQRCLIADKQHHPLHTLTATFVGLHILSTSSCRHKDDDLAI